MKEHIAKLINFIKEMYSDPLIDVFKKNTFSSFFFLVEKFDFLSPEVTFGGHGECIISYKRGDMEVSIVYEQYPEQIYCCVFRSFSKDDAYKYDPESYTNVVEFAKIVGVEEDLPAIRLSKPNSESVSFTIQKYANYIHKNSKHILNPESEVWNEILKRK